MSRTYFCADVHLANHRKFAGEYNAGINDRCARIASVLRSVAHVSGSLVVLGDLFDTASPSPQVIALAMRALERRSSVYVLLGNHEAASLARRDNALAPLGTLANIAVIDTLDRSVGDLHFIPFRPGAPAGWFPEAVASVFARTPASVPRLLGIHCGIEDETTSPFLRGHGIDVAMLRYLCSEHSIRAVFAGDWHTHKRWDFDDGGRPITIMQVGALVPTGFDNPGLDGYGTLAWYDSDTDEVGVDVEVGPRFLKLDWRRALGDGEQWHIPARGLDGNAHKLSDIYVRVKVDADLVGPARDFLNSVGLAGYEVEVDSADSAIEARTAAQAARSADTLEEALANFVAAMPLDASVSRSAVLELARAHLAVADAPLHRTRP